jgi:hypothetical protein
MFPFNTFFPYPSISTHHPSIPALISSPAFNEKDGTRREVVFRRALCFVLWRVGAQIPGVFALVSMIEVLKGIRDGEM